MLLTPIRIGSFVVPGASSLINKVSKDNKRLEGIIGARIQKIFDTLKWNTTYVIENLAGNYIPENDSYNGNIGLLERDLIDFYFTPNSINVLTRKIGLTAPITSNELMVMQIVDPLKTQAASDILNTNMASDYWLFYGGLFILLTILMVMIALRSHLFILKLLNKQLTLKNLIDLLLNSNFFISTMFIEQMKHQDQSDSMMRFIFAFMYIGIWLFNRLSGGLLQTEAFKIDKSRLITTLEQTKKSTYQACLLINEPLTYDFLSGTKKNFNQMFPYHSRHLYRAELNDILNFMRNHRTRVFVATSVFIKSVGFSVCSYFKEEFGDRKVFIPDLIIDEDIAVYYYNLKSSSKIISDVKNKLTFSAAENSLIHYQRNSYELNVLDSSKVQHACIVRNLKVLTEASIDTGSLDHKIELNSYIRFLSAYFLFITCILIITLVILLIHLMSMKLKKEQNTFLSKLGDELAEEDQLNRGNISRSQLDRLYVNIDTINQLVNSSEFYLYLNPFHLDIINEEYQLMRLKYRRIRNKIEDKILELDGHFQKNRNSIAQLNLNFTDRFPQKAVQREMLADHRLNQQLKSFFHQQTKQLNTTINLKDRSNMIMLDSGELGQSTKFNQVRPNRTYWQIVNRNTPEAKRNENMLDQKSGNMFPYILPNNLDLVVKKYSR